MLKERLPARGQPVPSLQTLRETKALELPYVRLEPLRVQPKRGGQDRCPNTGMLSE